VGGEHVWAPNSNYGISETCFNWKFSVQLQKFKSLQNKHNFNHGGVLTVGILNISFTMQGETFQKP
jgi:hypothetical protein